MNQAFAVGGVAVEAWRQRRDSWPRTLKLAAAPGAIFALILISITLSLVGMVYAQHANTTIVDHDMETVAGLGAIAARFDHQDGDLSRLMVDKAAAGKTVAVAERAAMIGRRLVGVRSDLLELQNDMPPGERVHIREVVSQIDNYADAVSVVSSMLDVDFASSVTMLAPFRRNAAGVIANVNAMVASGIAEAREHANHAAARTKLLVVLVSAAMCVVAVLSLVWLTLATQRAISLRDEMRLRGTAEANAITLARHDGLTGLFNRRVFVEEILRAIAYVTEANGGGFAIVLIDLDRFKEANDTHGHAAGDAVLKTVANRLRVLLGPSSVLARLGGDEFAALVPTGAGTSVLVALMERLAIKLREPIAWQETILRVGGSIGVSRYPTDALTPDALLHSADVAMYQAKRERVGTCQFFEPTMEAERIERRMRKTELQSGIPAGEIVPYYQPIIQLTDDRICGFEILARWHHPRLGLLLPGEFIQIAEITGQITELTESILRQACRHIAQLPTHLRFAINVSPVQLSEPGFALRLIDIVRSSGISPGRLEIELTEDAIMDDVSLAENVIAEFRQTGMTVALDDFGTGFSSLSNLRRLKFDKIKIDRSFVETMLVSRESEKLVDAVLHLADSFELKVTAEGIESREVADLLAAKGCTQGQGYFFGHPADFVKTLALSSSCAILAA